MQLSKSLAASAAAMIRRSGIQGEYLDEASLSGFSIPEWLMQLLSEYPLVGMEVGLERVESTWGLEGAQMFEIASGAMLKEINTECTPGIYLFPKYVSIGFDIASEGAVLAVDTTVEGLPVYFVRYDAVESEDGKMLDEEIRSGGWGTALMDKSLSSFFSRCIVDK